MSNAVKMLILTALLVMWSYVTEQRAFFVHPMFSFSVMQVKKKILTQPKKNEHGALVEWC